MDFNLSREHLLVRKMMREFTENEVKPITAETDAKCEYPRENIEKLFDLGVMGMCVPKEYGGAGADPLANAIAAGNTAILKPSAYAPATGRVVESLIGECFPPEYVAVVTGGREENAALWAAYEELSNKLYG